MCFIFSDRFELQRQLIASADYLHDSKSPQSTEPEREVPPSAIPCKRSAPSPPESKKTKVRKVVVDDDTSSEYSPSEAGVQIFSGGENAVDLTQESTAAKVRTKQLERQLAELKEKYDDLRDQKFELEVKEEKRVERVKIEKADDKATQRAVNKKVEESVKADYEDKIQVLKEKQNAKLGEQKAKFNQILKSKAETYRKKVEENKTKTQELEKKAKEEKAHYGQVERELKAETQELRKQLRDEQQEEIKKYKPEHSQAIREKNRALKEKQDEISECRRQVAELKTWEKELVNGKRRLVDETTQMKSTSASKDAVIKDLQSVVEARRAEIEKLTKARDDMDEQYRAKLTFEGKRWQLQFNNAQKLNTEIVQQQRTNFVLRNSNNRSAKRIEELEVEVQAAKDQIDVLNLAHATADEVLVDAEGQTTVTENDKGEKSTEHQAATILPAMMEDKSYQEIPETTVAETEKTRLSGDSSMEVKE